MTFSQDQRLEQNQTGKETDIFSNNFGGLNTLASPLNLPYEDSPQLENMDILISGVLQKRQGTRVLYKEEGLTSSQVGGTALIPFSTGLGYNFLIQKKQRDIRVFTIENDVATVRMTKSNVWDADGGVIRATYVPIADVEPKVLFCTGINRPVELKFVEKSVTVTEAGSFTTVVFPNDTRFVNATTANVLVFQDRVIKTNVTNVSYSGGNTTITFGSSVPAGTYTFDIELVVWQWYAEALLYKGDRFFKSVTQLTSQISGGTGLQNDPDQIIAVPDTLRDDIEANSNQNYPYSLFKSTAFLDAFGYRLDREPSTADEYHPSDGTPYKQAAGKKVNPSPAFITFGREFVPASATDGQSRPVYIARRRRILFNGSTTIQGQYLRVFVNGVQKSQNTNVAVGSPTYGDYWLLGSDWGTGGTIISNATDEAYYLSFEGATVIGVPADALIELVNVELKNIGSAAVSTRDDYLDGTYKPIYGLGLFANYASGSYPRNVSLYQGRLVFSGFPELPLTVVFSNVFDSVTPGVNYNSFQIDTFATSATDALDIVLSSQPDDVVKGLVEWQNNVFVLTRKAVFRIFGGQTVLTQTNKFSVFVSNIGLVNPYCVVRTDRSILYLSDIGVFDLMIQENTTEYEAAEKSIKIRSKFGITKDPAYETLAWLAYDNANRFVFVGLPCQGTTYTSDVLLVYNTFRESWTEYSTPIGFNGYTATSYIDRALGIGFLMGCSRYRDGSSIPIDFVLLKFGYEKYVDFAEHFTGNGSSTNYNAMPRNYVQHTTTNGVHEYPVSRNRTGQWRGFSLLPITSIQDCYITLDGIELAFGTDWVKLVNGNIYLMDNPGAGKTLIIYLRRPVTEAEEGQSFYEVSSAQNYQHELVFVDNVLQIPNSGYTTNESSGTYRVNINAPSNSVLVLGQAYKCLYSSPVFTQRVLMRLKRLKHLYALFDNVLSQEAYTVSDVNTSSGQSTDQIVGVPKVRQNVNVAIRIDSDDDAQTVYDLYGYATLVWDDSLFDIAPPPSAYRRDTLFKESLSGLGYSYQMLLWSFDESAFTFSGYQIVAPVKGERYINWTR